MKDPPQLARTIRSPEAARIYYTLLASSSPIVALTFYDNFSDLAGESRIEYSHTQPWSCGGPLWRRCSCFFAQAIARTDVRPHRVTTDKAASYPPALRAVVPEAEHITGTHIAGTMEPQGIERDHQHLKGRTRCMRGFQRRGCAQGVCDGHDFRRNLRDGFYRLGEPTGDPRIPQAPRLARAGDDLTQILAAA